uniref:uncharacterized protein LOC117159381 isoform X2 n=1 Tax=Bombus vancouverensis nearcticus TaxID=2705178 RepID=UPI0014389521|nr:uncharacterized protein LOC117159381 isoform X2 [Bombus vancouverensis nearcticus]
MIKQEKLFITITIEPWIESLPCFIDYQPFNNDRVLVRFKIDIVHRYVHDKAIKIPTTYPVRVCKLILLRLSYRCFIIIVSVVLKCLIKNTPKYQMVERKVQRGSLATRQEIRP